MSCRYLIYMQLGFDAEWLKTSAIINWFTCTSIKRYFETSAVSILYSVHCTSVHICFQSFSTIITTVYVVYLFSANLTMSFFSYLLLPVLQQSLFHILSVLKKTTLSPTPLCHLTTVHCPLRILTFPYTLLSTLSHKALCTVYFKTYLFLKFRKHFSYWIYWEETAGIE